MDDQAILARADLIALRPYTFTLVADEDGVWTSGVLELPGVVSEGDSPAEAVEMARDALREMLIVRLEDGLDILEPRVGSARGGLVPRYMHPLKSD